MKAYFRGRRAVVTGAASGIGAALSSALHDAGASIIACDVDSDGLARLVARLGRTRVQTQEFDVTEAAGFDAAIEGAAAQGNVDFLFNNAGIAIGGAVLDLTAEDWQKVIDINLGGVVNGVRAVYPHMVEQGSGHIVNIASVAGLAPFALSIPYTASKHAVVGLSLALRAEAAAHGVRVSTICPGTIETPIWHRSLIRGGTVSTELRERLAKGMSAERCAQLILRAVARNRALTTITGQAKMLSLLQRMSPALSVRLHRRIANWVRASSSG